jgi:hypothetical protein
VRFAAALVLLLGLQLPQGREIAVTFDDLPIASAVNRDGDGWARITDDLLASIARHQKPAIGFVNEQMLERGGAVVAGEPTVPAWIEQAALPAIED